jgi:DDE superfamily endonuclease
MAQRKKPASGSQPQHKPSQPSRHDQRGRLERANPERRRTSRALFPLVGGWAAAVAKMAGVLDVRMSFRLAIIVSGMLLADDRRTASSWFVAAGVLDDWDRFYDALISIGRHSRDMSEVVLQLVIDTLDPGPGGRITLAIDDTPEKRYGRHVEGAGVHHDPTPGPAGGEFCYGHNWVSLAWLAKHPQWGVIALSLRSLLYVRQVDVPQLDAKRGWAFATKHQLAAQLVSWFVALLRSWKLERLVWIVADGAYAARPFLDAVLAEGAVVVSRLRKDAALFDLPPARMPGQRGRPRKYGAKLSLAKRAAHLEGWQSIIYRCRGMEVTRDYKTFLAMSHLADKIIRVVLVRFDDGGWIPYFCTDSNATVQDILEAAADRWAIEEHFHDIKEVWGAGQQQVRNIWSNIGCWHLNQWLHTLVELASWDRPATTLVDRSSRPWDNGPRRPSHRDRRRTIAAEMLRTEFSPTPPSTPETDKYRALIESLITLCT